jgi:membrane peptidoglycan carboxypeptidase
MDEGIANLNQTVIPRARELSGFQGGYWLADRATGKVLAVVVYDSEEHIRQTDEVAAQLRRQMGSVAGMDFTGVETYEVIGQA